MSSIQLLTNRVSKGNYNQPLMFPLCKGNGKGLPAIPFLPCHAQSETLWG
jgi:hypothetical protein